MTDYYEQGKEMIIGAAEAQIEVFRKAEEINYTGTKGANASLYAIALRRIGEEVLAKKFIDPNPSVKPVVWRVSSYRSISHIVVDAIERGDKTFARKIERSQRKLFHLDGAGYWDPHFDMQSMLDQRERVRRQIIERQDPETGVYERVRRWTDQATGNPKSRGEGYRLGNVSLQEAMLAISMNLALNTKSSRLHAKKVLEDVMNLYQKDGEFIFIGTDFNAPETLTGMILRLADLEEDPRGRDLYEEYKEDLENPKESDYPQVLSVTGLSPLILVHDHFGNTDAAERIRELLLKRNQKVLQGFNRDPKHKNMAYGPEENQRFIETGLTLCGLERGKTNQYLII